MALDNVISFVICYVLFKSSVFYKRLDLFMHIQREIIQPAGILAAGTGTLPAAKGLKTRPSASGGTVLAVGIGATRSELRNP